MIALTHLMVNRSDFEPEDVYVISAVNSLEWKYQTAERFQKAGYPRVNVLHLKDIERLTNHKHYLKMKAMEEETNVPVEERKFTTSLPLTPLCTAKKLLVVIDEMHYGAHYGDYLHKFMDAFDLHRIDGANRRVRITHFTATPTNMWTMMKTVYPEHSKNFNLKHGEGYTSIVDLQSQSVLRQAKSMLPKLTNDGEYVEGAKEAAREFINTVLETYGRDYKYHLVRCGGGDPGVVDTAKAIGSVLNEMYTADPEGYIPFAWEQYVCGSTMNLKNYLNFTPTEHRILFLKEKARCAVTFNKHNIGVMYDRVSAKSNDKTQNQWNHRATDETVELNSLKGVSGTRVVCGAISGWPDDRILRNARMQSTNRFHDLGYVDAYVRYTVGNSEKTKYWWHQRQSGDILLTSG